MKLRNTFLNFVVACLIAGSINAQVEKVNLGLKFNPTTNYFDCYMKVTEGSALLSRHRIQFNAQISMAVPNGSIMTMEETYMPLVDNKDYKGSRPSKWYIANNVRNVETMNNSTVYSIIPSLTPTAFYNDLNQGEEVKLFSVKINPLPKCGEGVRLFENNSDPLSDDISMYGADFRNGFTLGGTNQKYDGNFYSENPMLPKGELVENQSIFINENTKLNAGEWSNAVAFEWIGPNGFKSMEKNPTINNVSLKNAGKYTLTVTSDKGCTVSKSTILDVKNVEDYTKDVSSATSNISENVKNNVVVATSKIYPNPVSNFVNLNISAAKGAKVIANIYGVDGKEIMANIVNQTMETTTIEKNIPLALPNGVYTMKVTIDGKDTEHRFICIE